MFWILRHVSFADNYVTIFQVCHFLITAVNVLKTNLQDISHNVVTISSSSFITTKSLMPMAKIHVYFDV